MSALFPHHVRRWAHALLLLGCGFFAMALPWLLERASPTLLEPIELWTVDLRFRLRPPLPVGADPSQATSDDVVLIDYDDRAGREYGLGRWPWDRRVHAQVIEWLKVGGARTIVLDLLFDYPAHNSTEDRAMAEAVRGNHRVFLPLVLRAGPLADDSHTIPAQYLWPPIEPNASSIPTANVWTLPLDGLLESAGGLGHIQRSVDLDGVLRRIPLVYRVKDGFIPSLALAALCRHLQIDRASIRIRPGQELRFLTPDGTETIIPVDAQGRTWINYAGPWGKRFVHYPYSWLLDRMADREQPPALTEWFQGKTVIVGNLTTASGDQGPMPFERDFVFSEVHAHLMNMILTRQFLRDAEPQERMLALALPVMLLTGLALLGGPTLILPSFLTILVGFLLLLRRAFVGGVVLPAVAPLVALATGLTLLLVVRFFIVDRERWRFLSILGSCLPPQTIREIRKNPGRISSLLTGRRRELTVLFADLEGFSTFCTQTDPQTIQRTLHEYLSAMSDTLRRHQGTLDKYMGDGIMAFFGDADPEDAGEDGVASQAVLAVKAALAMQQRMAALNEEWARSGRPRHRLRIGLNTGMVTVGNLGTDYLWDYTVIGAEVNKAQRLESAAPPGGILMAQRTYLLAARRGLLPQHLPSQTLPLKGIGSVSDLYAIPPDSIDSVATSATTEPMTPDGDTDRR